MGKDVIIVRPGQPAVKMNYAGERTVHFPASG